MPTQSIIFAYELPFRYDATRGDPILTLTTFDLYQLEEYEILIRDGNFSEDQKDSMITCHQNEYIDGLCDRRNVELLTDILSSYGYGVIDGYIGEDGETLHHGTIGIYPLDKYIIVYGSNRVDDYNHPSPVIVEAFKWNEHDISNMSRIKSVCFDHGYLPTEPNIPVFNMTIS